MNNNTLFYQDKCARITPKSNGGEQGTTPNHSEQGLALILEKKKKHMMKHYLRIFCVGGVGCSMFCW